MSKYHDINSFFFLLYNTIFSDLDGNDRVRILHWHRYANIFIFVYHNCLCTARKQTQTRSLRGLCGLLQGRLKRRPVIDRLASLSELRKSDLM